MKKLLLSVAVVSLALCGAARTLSPDEALARVSSQGAAKAPSLAGNLELVATGSYEGLTTYYVFSNSKASMIVGADDLAVPVLAFLDAPVSVTTPVPDNFQWWLNEYGRELKFASDNSSKQYHFAASTPKNNFTVAKKYVGKVINNGISSVEPRSDSRAPIAPLLKTAWDQGAPYNNLCPTGCYTGCVATSMSQVMKYHSYPEKGVGSASVTYNGKKLTMNLAGTYFKWADMLDSYTATTPGTAAQKEAVATLMKAAGYSVNMNYGTQASGAVSNQIVAALVDNFGYDKGIEFLNRDFMAPEQWIERCYAELQAGRPLIYGGRGSDGGHSFVCDGYRADDYFHFNWGWSGAYDGYFVMTSLVPEGQGAGGNSDGFTYDQDALFGVQKPVAGSTLAPAYMSIMSSHLIGSFSGRSVTLSSTSGFGNNSGWGASFYIGYALEPAAGGAPVYNTIYTSSYFQAGSYVASLEFTIPTSVANGNYKLYPVYKTATGDWQKMQVAYECVGELDITINGNTITDNTSYPDPPTPPTPGGSVSFSEPSTSTGFTAGQEYDLTVTISNTAETDYTENLATGVINDNYFILSDGSFQTVTVPAGGSKKVTFKATIDADVTAGEYVVVIYNESLSIKEGWYVDVESTATPASTIEVSDWGLPSAFSAGSDANVNVTVKNTGSSIVNTSLELAIMHTGDGNNLYVDYTYGNKATNAIFPNKTKVLSYTGTLPETLAAGQYYLGICEGNNVLDYTMITVTNVGGVSDIFADDAEEGVARYFDLQGREVNKNNLLPGLYIRRTPSGSKKILVR